MPGGVQGGDLCAGLHHASVSPSAKAGAQPHACPAWWPRRTAGGTHAWPGPPGGDLGRGNGAGAGHRGGLPRGWPGASLTPCCVSRAMSGGAPGLPPAGLWGEGSQLVCPVCSSWHADAWLLSHQLIKKPSLAGLPHCCQILHRWQSDGAAPAGRDHLCHGLRGRGRRGDAPRSAGNLLEQEQQPWESRQRFN